MLLLSGCSSSSGLEHVDEVDPSEAVAVTPQISTITFVIQRTFSGGATGDTLYKVWSCRAPYRDCRLQAMVDTHDKAPPRLAYSRNDVRIIINRSDTVWQFSNKSIQGTDGALHVELQYS